MLANVEILPAKILNWIENEMNIYNENILLIDFYQIQCAKIFYILLCCCCCVVMLVLCYDV